MLKFLTTLSFSIILLFGYVTGTHNVLAYEAEKAISAHKQPKPIALKMASEISAPVEKKTLRTHTVKKGEWLSKIAVRHNLTIRALVEANTETYPSLTKNPSLIHPGWTLVIPTTTNVSPENSVAQAKQSVYPEMTAQAVPRDKQVSSPPRATKKHRAKSTKPPSEQRSTKSDTGIRLRLERNIGLVDGIIDRYHPIIMDERTVTPVPTSYVLGMIFVESRGDPNAISPVGARGTMQLMPGTHAELGLTKRDAFHPEKNVRAGMRYLRMLYERLGNDEDAAIAAYERGEQGIRNAMARGVDPARIEYVRNVKAAASFFKERLKRRT